MNSRKLLCRIEAFHSIKEHKIARKPPTSILLQQPLEKRAATQRKMSVNYIPPSQRLFRARHRVSRRDLQHLSSTEADWSTVLDLSIDSDSQLISYTVPVIGSRFVEPQQPFVDAKSQSNRSTLCSECSFLSNSTDTSSVFDPNLKQKMQGNLSLESLMQENKKKIYKRQESIDLFKSLRKNVEVDRLAEETKREVLKLRYENKHLLVREKELEKSWQAIREQDNSMLLLNIRSQGMYWFGIPGDLRESIYRACLYDYAVKKANNKKLLQNISGCFSDEKLASQIYSNMCRHVDWLNEEVQCRFTKIIETRLQQQFGGLYYHLKDTLKISIFADFIKPLLVNSISNALKEHTRDEISLELLDILVFSAYNKTLETVLLDDLLFVLLARTYYKFFGDKLAFKTQLESITIDLVDVLEAIRQIHGTALLGITRD